MGADSLLTDEDRRFLRAQRAIEILRERGVIDKLEQERGVKLHLSPELVLALDSAFYSIENKWL